jgi:DNA-3-methyladenine glycosylase II
VTPAALLTLDDAELKTAGFSRQKTAYARGLAQAILAGELDLEALAYLDDEDVRKALTHLKGIGPWTADIYLLMALGRPNIWPAQDLGLVVAVRRGFGLTSAPSRQDMETIGAEFHPYRSVATRFFWHYYLSELHPPKS